MNDRVVDIELELSFLPLYEGGMLIRDALDLVYSLGFTLMGLRPGVTDPPQRVLQADGTFLREEG